MKLRSVLLLVTVFAVFLQVAEAQPVSLPDDSSVVRGGLGNGLEYYIIKDSRMTGVADFSLLRRVGRIDEVDARGWADVAAAAPFGGTQSMTGEALESFVAAAGLELWKDVYFTVADDFTLFNIRGVRTGTAYADSALLFLYDVARGEVFSQERLETVEERLKGLYPVITCGEKGFAGTEVVADSLNDFLAVKTPMSQQALIVVGDVDVERTVRDISMMFMTVPYRDFAGDNPYMLFKASDSMKVYVSKLPDRNGCADIRVSYMSKALPFPLRNSVVTVISAQMKDFLGELITRRMRDYAELDSLALLECSVSLSHWGSARDAEVFTINLKVPSDDVGRAVSGVASVLADIDAYGFSMQEYVYARMCYDSKVSDLSPEDSRLVWKRKAVQHYLEGASLASEESEREYLISHRVRDSLGWAFLNKFARTMIDGSRNLRLSAAVAGNSVTDSLLRSAFVSGWASGDSLAVAVRERGMVFPDTASLPAQTRNCRVLFVRPETATSSQILSMSNGLKLYYRQFPDDNIMRFAFSFRGGFAANEHFRPGFGAFVSDWMKLDSIAGMPYVRFEQMLRSYGISLDYEMDARSFTIKGTAPAENTDIVWRAVNAVMNERTPDSGAFERYMRRWQCGRDEDIESFVRDTLDAIMHPSGLYTSIKRADVLSSLEYADVRDFLGSAMNVLGEPFVAFSTPLDIEKFKEVVSSECVWLKRGKRSRRLVAEEETVCSGTITSRLSFPVEHPFKKTEILFSLPMGYTAENKVVSDLAAALIGRRVNACLAGQGVSVSVSAYFRSLPDERTYLHLSAGFPDDVLQMKALPLIKEAMTEMTPRDAEYLEMSRAELVQDMASVSGSSRFWIEMLHERHVGNKDIYSTWSEEAASVTLEQVQDYIEAVAAGGCVELLVRGK